MSVCGEIKKDYSLSCSYENVKLRQRIVLINKNDINKFVINGNSIRFNLIEGKRGFLYEYFDEGTVISANYNKTDRNNIPYFKSNISLFLNGVDLENSNIQDELNLSNYFCAVLYSNGVVKIFSFHYGLKTDSYTYDEKANINLISREDEPNQPYIYESMGNSAEEDFDNLFEDLESPDLGDFNDDFNNDFFIEI